MIEKNLFIFLLANFFSLFFTHFSYSNLLPSAGFTLDYIGNEDLKGDWSLSLHCAVSTKTTDENQEKISLGSRLSANKRGDYTALAYLKIADQRYNQQVTNHYNQNIPINFKLQDLKTASVKELEVRHQIQGNLYKKTKPVHQTTALCIPHIDNVMDIQLTGTYADGYLKKEIAALQTPQANQNAVFLANLLVFNQITAMLDDDPKKLAQIKKECDNLKSNTYQENKKRLQKIKENYNKTKHTLSETQQKEYEYKIARLEKLYE